ncbi:MAG: hypothetical protein ACRDHY_19185, partial [Anaerolineales bacterium]
MSASVNRVLLLGTISRYGVELRTTGTGTACASFVLIVSEQGQDGIFPGHQRVERRTGPHGQQGLHGLA